MTVETEGGFWLVLAMMLLLFPLELAVGTVLAAAVHELGHILAIRLTGGRVRRLVLRPGGACLETDPMGSEQELLCALAGPAAGLLITAAWRVFPAAALAGLVQSAFNLLPLYPLDGGRALRTAGEIWEKHTGNHGDGMV